MTKICKMHWSWNSLKFKYISRNMIQADAVLLESVFILNIKVLYILPLWEMTDLGKEQEKARSHFNDATPEIFYNRVVSLPTVNCSGGPFKVWLWTVVNLKASKSRQVCPFVFGTHHLWPRVPLASLKLEPKIKTSDFPWTGQSSVKSGKIQL